MHSSSEPSPTASLGIVPVAALVFNAFVWGLSWWPLRRLEAAGVHPLWATAIVFVLPVALITVLRPRAWRELAHAPALWWLVLAAGATNAAFNWGVTVGDVVRVVLLFYLMPLWVALLARVLLHERFTRIALARTGLALSGAAVVLWPPQGGYPLPAGLADWLGLIGGFAFALNNVLLRHQQHQSEGARALAMFVGGGLVAGVLAAVLTLGGLVPAVPSVQPGWLGVALVLGLLFLSSNLGLQFGAARLPANTTAVIMLTEILFAAGSALALDGGELTPRLAGGGALIVAAALLAALERSR